jgi:thioredoxin-related protein/outer membrane protein assembly factor BamD (BamD/ComL family)
MTRTWKVLAVLVLIESAIRNPQSAIAQEVQWRTDYNKARQEAVDKGRPLLLDFGTENCFYCKKLDATTFRDPTVVSVLNKSFIPLKIDAERNAALADALRVERYPTLVLAAPDGKILATQEGYMEALRCHELLQRALASVSNPEWMARDYQEAVKAIAASDFARAIALLRSVIEDKGNRPVQQKARQVLDDLEQQAAGLLARAKQHVDKGQTDEAVARISELVRAYAGTQAATEGGHMLGTLAGRPEITNQQRVKRARDLLAQAREEYRTQHFLACLDRCDDLAASFADLPEGADAIQLAAQIKNNPEWMKQVCESLSDRLGVLYLSLAETLLKKGQPQQATIYLERVVQTFPGTRQAEAAQVRLAQIQGLPAQTVDFKKQ